MREPITETLEFKGYVWEGNSQNIPEKVCGVYCAYACKHNKLTNEWVGSDIVYFGKSGGDVRGRVNDHKKAGDTARKTLQKGEGLLYCYAETDHEEECEKALVAAHSNLPRLANDKLTGGYKGPVIHLTITGASFGICGQIDFDEVTEKEFTSTKG